MIKYPNVKDPLKDAVSQIVNKVPPFDFGGAYKFSDLPVGTVEVIADWCSKEICQARYAEWATGSSIISAAEQMVEEAQWNANIAPQMITT